MSIIVILMNFIESLLIKLHVLRESQPEKAFFKRNTPVEKLSPELLKNMKGILQEGVILLPTNGSG